MSWGAAVLLMLAMLGPVCGGLLLLALADLAALLAIGLAEDIARLWRRRRNRPVEPVGFAEPSRRGGKADG